VQPAGLSISQVTEAGTIYSLEEIVALSDMAHAAGVKVHLDGARFANAMVSLGCTPADMTWKAGVDIVSFGATKNGCLAAEAVLFFDPQASADFMYQRKRSGHTISKGRLLGAQIVGYLENDHWIDNARRANASARTLADGLGAIAGVTLPWPVQANEVFAFLPARMADALTVSGFRFAPWSSDALPAGLEPLPDQRFVRFVTSFQSRAEDIDGLLTVARKS
jgi:threonine aldolase